MTWRKFQWQAFHLFWILDWKTTQKTLLSSRARRLSFTQEVEVSRMKDRSVYHEKRIICITVNSTKRSLIIRSRSAPKRVLARAILVYQFTILVKRILKTTCCKVHNFRSFWCKVPMELSIKLRLYVVSTKIPSSYSRNLQMTCEFYYLTSWFYY